MLIPMKPVTMPSLLSITANELVFGHHKEEAWPQLTCNLETNTREEMSYEIPDTNALDKTLIAQSERRTFFDQSILIQSS